MKPLARTNLMLAAGVLLLGLVNWFEPGLRPTTPERITTLDVNQVHVLKLYRQQQLMVSLQRKSEHWVRLSQSAEDCTDCEIRHPHLIQQWLHFAELPSLHSFPAPKGRLKEFGLAEPAYQLQLDDQSIFFGRLDPGSRLRYVLVNEHIHLISDSYYHTLEQTP